MRTSKHDTTAEYARSPGPATTAYQLPGCLNFGSMPRSYRLWMSAQRLWRSAMRSNGFDLFGVRRGGQRLAELGCEHRATHFREGMAPVGGHIHGGQQKDRERHRRVALPDACQSLKIVAAASAVISAVVSAAALENGGPKPTGHRS